MVVVTLIGLLASIAIPSFQRIKLRAVSSNFVSDMRIMEEAFQGYAQEFGKFPADTAAGVVPTGMAGYIDADRWASATALGGNYKWYDAGSYIGIMIIAPTASLSELSLIDEWIDDGNVGTGLLLVTGAGSVVLHVMEERT